VTGSCHCGAVTIELAHKPEYMFDCNCSMCLKHGVLWGYFAVSDVVMSGETQTYSRPDRDKPSVFVHFCGICGCTTHWSATTHSPQDQMGTNMRLFAESDLTGTALHFPDGAGWSGEGPFGMRRESAVF
jgi:hypothetical protein